MRLWLYLQDMPNLHPPSLLVQKFFEGALQTQDLSLAFTAAQTFIDYVEFPKNQTSAGQVSLPIFNYELSETFLSQALNGGKFKKELVMYAIVRDTKLYDLKPDYQRLQGSPAQGKQIRFFLAPLMERHHITVANHLKDI